MSCLSLITRARADSIYENIKAQAKGAAIRLIEKERDGELIDRTLLKNILGIFIEVGMGGMECYERDFEATLLSETSTFYKRRAALWIDQVWGSLASSANYMDGC